MTSHSVSNDEIPKWLRNFVTSAISGILDTKWHAPIGCHCHQYNTEWEVTLFLTSTEVVGGAMDGAEIPVPFQVEINRVMSCFDHVPSVHWQSDKISEDDSLKQHISFQGTVKNNKVWLRILKCAPEGTTPGRLLCAFTGKTTDVW
ncbi:MAG: hypothetical protein KDA81_00890 [Planctomycetaceae bacterium]|nr:hypothetical protein [Planctomycetaceae bacterium]